MSSDKKKITILSGNDIDMYRPWYEHLQRVNKHFNDLECGNYLPRFQFDFSESSASLVFGEKSYQALKFYAGNCLFWAKDNDGYIRQYTGSTAYRSGNVITSIGGNYQYPTNWSFLNWKIILTNYGCVMTPLLNPNYKGELVSSDNTQSGYRPTILDYNDLMQYIIITYMQSVSNTDDKKPIVVFASDTRIRSDMDLIGTIDRPDNYTIGDTSIRNDNIFDPAYYFLTPLLYWSEKLNFPSWTGKDNPQTSIAALSPLIIHQGQYYTPHLFYKETNFQLPENNSDQLKNVFCINDRHFYSTSFFTLEI